MFRRFFDLFSKNRAFSALSKVSVSLKSFFFLWHLAPQFSLVLNNLFSKIQVYQTLKISAKKTFFDKLFCKKTLKIDLPSSNVVNLNSFAPEAGLKNHSFRYGTKKGRDKNPFHYILVADTMFLVEVFL